MSICFFDKSNCSEAKNILIEYISENGEKSKFWCCDSCIKNKIPNKLVINTNENDLKNKKCPNCSINLNEIIDSGKIGCPLCYSFFYNEIKILVTNCQNSKTQNCGKIPLGMHHKSPLVACIMKDLEKINQTEAVKELKEYFKNF